MKIDAVVWMWCWR